MLSALQKLQDDTGDIDSQLKWAMSLLDVLERFVRPTDKELAETIQLAGSKVYEGAKLLDEMREKLKELDARDQSATVIVGTLH